MLYRWVHWQTIGKRAKPFPADVGVRTVNDMRRPLIVLPFLLLAACGSSSHASSASSSTSAKAATPPTSAPSAAVKGVTITGCDSGQAGTAITYTLDNPGAPATFNVAIEVRDNGEVLANVVDTVNAAPSGSSTHTARSGSGSKTASCAVVDVKRF